MQIPITQALAEARQLTDLTRRRFEGASMLGLWEIIALCDALDRLAAVVDHDGSGIVDVPKSAWVRPSSGPEVQP